MAETAKTKSAKPRARGGKQAASKAPTLPPAAPGSLRLTERPQYLERAKSEEWDVVVIGGGITGTGCALDAASRGLKTLLLERVDIAAGTSRWSSKLCHGGLRYLAQGQINVAYESARERHWILTSIAPHLSRAEAFIVPINKALGPVMGAVTGAGTIACDILRRFAGTPSSALPGPKFLNRARAAEACQALEKESLRGAIKYWDGQLVDDAKYVTAVARTAHAHGATVLTRAGVTGISLVDGIASGRDGVGYTLTVRDELAGEGATDAEFTVRAREVIVASGVWAQELAPNLRVLPSRGTHIAVPSSRMGNPRGVLVTTVPGHLSRFIFVLPQNNGLCYIGLTDVAAPGVDGVRPPVPDEDEEFLLDCVNRVMEIPLTRDDIVGRFAGLRPLVQDKAAENAAESSDVSRKHLLVDEPGNPLVIVGGKFTTYRRMAQDAVDAACARLGRPLPCRTRRLPLVGATSRKVLAQLPAPTRLVELYGAQAATVMELAEQYPEFAGPVAEGLPTIGAEFLFGILHEGALTVDDVVERRTRCTMVETALPAARAKAEEAFKVLGLTPLA